MAGFNGTVFVYGGRKSGKTYTIWGTAEHREGIIYNAIDQIFEHVAANSSQTTKFMVGFSDVEILKEKIRDLLGENPNENLPLTHSPKTGVTFAEGLSEHRIKSAEDVYKLRGQGSLNRTIYYGPMVGWCGPLLEGYV